MGTDNRGLTERVMSSGIWMFSGAGVQGLLRLLVLTTLARLLGPPEFGLAAAATVVIAFFQVLNETGIRASVIQRPRLEERHLRTAFTVSLLIGLVAASAIFAIAPSLATKGFGIPELTPVIRAMALLLPIQSLGTVAVALMHRELRFPLVMRTEISSYLIGYAPVGLWMAFAGFGVWSLVAAYIAQEILRTSISLYMQPHPKRPGIELAALRELVFFGSGFALARFGNWGALNGDKWVVGRWLGSDALGFYKYAFDLTQMICTLFGQVLDKVLFPAMARVQNEPARLATAYRGGVALVSVLTLPTGAVLFVLAPEIIWTVLGDGWDPAIGPFRVLSLALMIRSSYTVSDSLARGTGAVYPRAWRQAIYAASVVLLAWLGQREGLVALTIGVTIGIFVNFLLMADLSVKLSKLTWRDSISAHFGAVPSFALALLASWAAASAVRSIQLHDLAVLIVAGSATAVALLSMVRIAPESLLGKDGLHAVRLLWSFGEAQLGPRFSGRVSALFPRALVPPVRRNQ